MLRKGMFQTIPVMITILIGMTAIVLFVVLFLGKATVTVTELQPSYNQLAAVDITHSALSCLGNERGVIAAENLPAETDDFSICSVPDCESLCSLSKVGVLIEDLVDGTRWDYDYEESGKLKHSIFTTIESNGEKHTGRIHVTASI